MEQMIIILFIIIFICIFRYFFLIMPKKAAQETIKIKLNSKGYTICNFKFLPWQFTTFKQRGDWEFKEGINIFNDTQLNTKIYGKL